MQQTAAWMAESLALKDSTR